MIVHAAGSGPTVAITANIHGDEATGVAVVQEVDRLLTDRQVRGMALLYPTLNPAGLTARTRVHPSGHDLNRLFPGVRKGSPSERHVHGIWEDLLARNVDLVVDLHADSGRSVPYAIVDRALSNGKGRGLAPRLEQLAAATGLIVLREYPEDQYLRYSLDRSLAGALVNRASVAAVTIEAGPRRWLDPNAVELAAGAVLRVLQHVGMVEGAPPAPVAFAPCGPWRREAAPRTRRTGLFREVVPPGGVFAKGDVLGRVVDLEGEEVDRLVAPRAGVVISWAETAWLAAGSAAGTIGVEDDRA
ncbi:MAG: succinylglutamate desuccinylase/aspartoacylase family protein [Myxococcales bacterium]|nr:succinylglutamate desuccinylase/aspartoacylase family protein [Myxococcales bacterium]MCB9669482.1 succinylglutamate desuccinylase/aspartoacylase family protein [Alphaproteobacteria bacterium]MCB9692135.1 succinylglutamate desuccinylase/aspartoacylase family protein [Alphaproteobacteria bacterium]